MFRSLVRSRQLGRFYSSAPGKSSQVGKPVSHGDGTQKPGTRLNVQSDAVSKGQQERKDKHGTEPSQDLSGQGGEKSTEGKGKGKDEWDTKAPGPVIGMQDERGTKEH